MTSTTVRRPSRLRLALMLAVGVAVAVAVGLAVLMPTRQVFEGLPEAGPLVTLLLPAVKVLGQLAAAVTVGWLLAAAWLVPPQPSGVLDVDGYRAVRAASWTAAGWAVLSVGTALLSISDAVGRPLADVLTRPDRLVVAIGALESVRAWLLTAAAATLVAVLARMVLRPGGAAALLGVAVLGILPQAAAGHAAQTSNHDVAVDGMVFHLLGMCVWVGGLVAVLVLARHRSPHLSTITARYSTVALCAFVAVAGSGVLNASLRLSAVDELWTTGYGRLLLLKTGLLVLLGAFGVQHRRRTLPAVRAGDRRAFRRVAAIEVLVLAATVGVATALGRTAPPPPAPELAEPTDAERILGFAVDGPPTPLAMLTQWRFDWILGTAAVLAAVVYLVAVHRLRRRGIAWARRRTVAWVSGCAVIVLATSSGLGRYAEAQFSMHMIAHMLLGMTAPALLVLGGPVTLALRLLPAAPRGTTPGAREAIVAALHSRAARFVTHPVVVLIAFIASLPAVYFTPLFGILVADHFGHLLMNVHFLLVGYLYYWVIIGVDPAPRRIPFLAKFGMLLVPLPFHSFAGIAMMSTRTPRAADFYQSLGLPWVPDLAADQRVGGAIAWAAVEGPVVIVILALVAQWAGSDAREARRADRRGFSRADEELAAYNRMLARLSEHDAAEHDAADRGAGPRTAPRTTRSAVPTGPRPPGPPHRPPVATGASDRQLAERTLPVERRNQPE